MSKCVIDGREVEFKPGENMIEAAKRNGIEIPFFCYHPGMTVVAQCRMCYVEVEKMAKLQTACSTALAEGMVIKTKSDRVKQAQKATMEFLLINHPLDCPICDKSGECDLQDNSFKHGDAYMRYTEERRTYMDLDMGPVIKKNMNRCIHCTRCIRYGEEIAGIHEMVAVKRGNNTEITTIDGRPLETDYAGGYSDVCPTGSLTLKDFRFKKRAWYLKKAATICEGCSRGCNMEIQQDNNVIYRCIPRENMEVNKYWMCDEGRFNYHYVHHKDRILEPATRGGAGLDQTDWTSALDQARTALKGKKVTILVGSDLTQEEGKALQLFAAKSFPGSELFHFGTPGIKSAADDAPADKILKRKSKTGNLHGLEKLGYKGFAGMPAGADAALVFRGGRAVLPDLKGLGTVVGVGVFNKPLAEKFAAVLPGPSFAEKDGTIVNFDGREQKLKRALMPRGMSKPLSEILMMWTARGAGTGRPEMDTFDWVTMGAKIAVIVVALIHVAPIMAWVERRGSALMQNRLGPNRVGPLGLLQSLADAVKFIMKEDAIPTHVNKFYYLLAPIVSVTPAFMTFAVIPFASHIEIAGREINFQIADLNVGVLYIFAVASLGVYGVIMSGWSSNNKYAMLGALRSSSQMISYELSMGLSIIGLIMSYESVSLREIAYSSGQHLVELGHLGPIALNIPKWGIFIQPLGFLIFITASFAETNRLPFDLPEGESEIVAGYHLEYGSMKFALLMMAEMVNMTTAAGLIATLYFGGWQLPGMHYILDALALDGMMREYVRVALEVATFAGKLTFFMWFFVWVRWTLPRFRYDQLMDLGWKVMLPLSLVNIFATGVLIYYKVI